MNVNNILGRLWKVIFKFLYSTGDIYGIINSPEATEGPDPSSMLLAQRSFEGKNLSVTKEEAVFNTGSLFVGQFFVVASSAIISNYRQVRYLSTNDSNKCK